MSLYFLGTAFPTPTVDTGKSTTEMQYGVVYDLLSAGEIEGLVGGLSGIYFNKTSLLSTVYGDLKAKVGQATVTGTSIKFTPGLLDGVNLADGTRWVQIANAGISGTTSNNATSGSNQIILTTALFESKHSKSPLNPALPAGPSLSIKHSIRIPGGGTDGEDYVGAITGLTGQSGDKYTTAYIWPALGSPVPSGTTITVDDVKKLTAIDQSTHSGTLESAVSINVTNQYALISQAVGNQNINTPYRNARGEVTKGERYQELPEIAKSNNVPNASFMSSASSGTSIEWSSVAGNPDSSAQNPINIDYTTFSLPQNSHKEVDKILVNIAFPGGLYHMGPQGGKQNQYAEFQIVFNYKKEANGPTFKALLIGKDYGGDDFHANVPTWPASGSRSENAIDNHINTYRGGTSTNTGMLFKYNQQTPFNAQFSADVSKYQPFEEWSITIKRMLPDAGQDYANNNHQIVANAVLKSVEAQILDKFSYPTSAYGVVGFSAEDFPSPPERAYHLKGRKIRVPSNYITRDEVGEAAARYTRDWQTGLDTGEYQPWVGTFRGDKTLVQGDTGWEVNFKEVYCNNPAWVFYDILTNKDYGLGEFISEEDIDIYELYQIGRYCDELVDDGKGGVEPRFACNVYLSSQTEAYKVLKDLASTFRSMMFWLDGKVTLIQDKPKEPVYTFTQGNIENGIFNYTYTGQRARINQVNVSWNNPDEFYKQTVITLDDIPNQIKQERIISKDVVAFGCTSEGQANRLGRWHLLTDTQETEIVEFVSGRNAGSLRPGDIVNIQDHNEEQLQYSGRINGNSSAAALVLDREVDLGATSWSTPEYYITIIIPEKGYYLAQNSATINGTSYVRGDLVSSADLIANAGSTDQDDVINLVDDSDDYVETQYAKTTKVEKRSILGVSNISSGTSGNTISVDSNFSITPTSEAIWALSSITSSEEAEIKQYRIVAVKEEDNGLKYSFTATNYYLPKFDEIDTSYPIYAPTQFKSAPANDPVPVPTDLRAEIAVTGESHEDSTFTAQDLVISWSAPVETVETTNGGTAELPYRWLRSFEIQHNIISSDSSSGYVTVEVPRGQTALLLPNISSGNYTIRVRTVNSSGAKSRWVEINQTLSVPNPNAIKTAGISRGGHFTNKPKFNKDTGVFSVFNPFDFNFISVTGQDFVGSGAEVVYEQETKQSFSIMDSFSVGEEPLTDSYLFFDASEAKETDRSTRDPWKVAFLHTDTTQQDLSGASTNFQYIKPLHTSADLQTNGLVAVDTAIRVSTTQGSSKVTLSEATLPAGFTLTDHLVEGDLIKISATDAGTESATDEYGIIIKILDNTSFVTENVFLRDATSSYLLKQRYPVEFAKDSIVARVSRGADFNIEWYATYPYEETVDPKPSATLYAHYPLDKMEIVKTGTETIITPGTSSSTSTVTVTQGTSSTGYVSYAGYYNTPNTTLSPFGSVSPTTIGDYTVQAAYTISSTSGKNLIFQLADANKPVDKYAFTSLVVETTTGTKTLYPDDSFTIPSTVNGQNRRLWMWGSYNNKITTQDLAIWDGSGDIDIILDIESTSIGTTEEIATYDFFFKDNLSSRTAVPSAAEDTQIISESPSGLAGAYHSTSTDGITLLTDTEADDWMNGSYSVSLWARFTEEFTTNTDRVLFSRDDSEYFELLVRQTSSPKLVLKVKETSGIVTYDSIDIQKGSWFNPIISVDGSNLKLYLDGIEVASTAAYSPGTTDRPVTVGAHTEAAIQASTQSFVGEVTEVKLFKGTLSGAEADAVSSSPTSSSSKVTYTDGTPINDLKPAVSGADKTVTKLNEGLTITEEAGGIVLSSAGALRTEGQTTEAATANGGVFLGYNSSAQSGSGAYTFGVGDTDQNIQWDGAELNIKGELTADSFALSSGATITDDENLIKNYYNNAYFKYDRTVEADGVTAPTSGDSTETLDADKEFYLAFGRTPRLHDIVVVTNTVISQTQLAPIQEAYKWSGTSWDTLSNFLTGDLIVDGTITADHIVANEVILPGNLTDGTFGGTYISSSQIYHGTGNFNNQDTDFYLDSNGQFSLQDKLSFDGTNLSVNGNISATSLTLDSGITIGSTNLPNDTVYDNDLITSGSTAIHGANITTGTVNTDRLDVADILTVGRKNIADQTFTHYQKWDFINDAEGWTVNNGTITENADSTLLLEDTTNDPQFRSPSDLAIYGKITYIVRARVKRVSGTTWHGACFYTTSGHGESGSYYKTISDTTVTGEWVILEWDMSNLTAGGTDWLDNEITRIRLDFGQDSTDPKEDHFLIDWVAIGSIGNGGTSGILGAGVTIEPDKLYQGNGIFKASNTGFYLDSAGKFSLADKLYYDPTENTNGVLNVTGEIVADQLTVDLSGWSDPQEASSGVWAAGVKDGLLGVDALSPELKQWLAETFRSNSGVTTVVSTTYPDISESEVSGYIGGTTTPTDGGSTAATSEYTKGPNDLSASISGTFGWWGGSASGFTLAVYLENSTDQGSTWQTVKSNSYTVYPAGAYYGAYYYSFDIAQNFVVQAGDTNASQDTDYVWRARVASNPDSFYNQYGGVYNILNLSIYEQGVVTSSTSTTSGDADTLDSLHATSFMRSDADTSTTGNLGVGGNLTVTGNLQVDGTTTTINSTTVSVDDKNIELASGSTNKSAADGAGITVDCGSDTDATILYEASTDSWVFNKTIATPGMGGEVTTGSSKTTLTTTTATNIASFVAADYTGGKFIIIAKRGTETHATELLLIHDGTDVSVTEYGTVISNTSIATYTASISGTNVIVQAAGSTVASTDYTVLQNLFSS